MARDALEFETEVDPEPIYAAPRDQQRKNIWLSNQLVQDLQDIAAEDETNLSVVIRQGLKHYVRFRKEGSK